MDFSNINLPEADDLAHRSRKFKARIPVSHEERRGRCYELAGRYVTADGDAGCILYHGSIFNPRFSTLGPIFHAWVELPGGWKYDPVADWVLPSDMHNDLFNPDVLARYTEDETRLEIVKSEHWGPWHPDLYDPSKLIRDQTK